MNRPSRDIPLAQSWISNEWRFILSVVTPVLAIALAWGAFQTKLAVLDQRLNTIENNHLVHLQASFEQEAKDIEQLKVDVAEIRILLEK